ncbi:MAG: hypothetical protein ACRBF0_23270 [Calditrichia bacterium]
MQLILAAFLLILAAVSRIDEVELPIPLFEWIYIIVNVLTAIANLLLAFVGSRLPDDRKKNRFIRIVFLMTGFVLMMDAIDSVRVGTQYLHYMKFLAASLFLLLAISYKFIHDRRGIFLNDEYLLIRSSPIRSSSFKWKEIEHIRLSENMFSITLTDQESKAFQFVGLPQKDDFVESMKKYSAGWNITLEAE